MIFLIILFVKIMIYQILIHGIMYQISDPLAIVSKRREKNILLYTNVHLTYVDGDKMGFPSLKSLMKMWQRLLRKKF